MKRLAERFAESNHPVYLLPLVQEYRNYKVTLTSLGIWTLVSDCAFNPCISM